MSAYEARFCPRCRTRTEEKQVDVELFDITVKHHPLGRYNFSTTKVASVADATGEPSAATDAEAVEYED